MTEPRAETTFLSPFDVPTPEGAEGWEEMYPYYLLFDPERREAEENRFWFYNGMHFPEPMPAFDMITAESCYLSIGLYQGRVFQIPTVLGIEHRVVNGYVYITANEVSDPAEIEKRLEVFLPRIGFYYQNWDMLVDRWQAAVDRAIQELDGARGAAPARDRGRAGAAARPQARLELPADDGLRPLHRPLQRAQPAAFRAAAARLRRVPDVLPVLPGGVPGHGDAGDDADDRGLQHDDVPARTTSSRRSPARRSRTA